MLNTNFCLLPTLFRNNRSTGIISFLAVLLVSGCGGQRDSSGTVGQQKGRATVAVAWPTDGRLIPLASKSISVKVISNNRLLGEGLLLRPTNGGTATLTLTDLPVGPANVEAKALPTTEGAGIALAQAAVPISIVAGQETPVRLSLTSTIDHLDISADATSLLVGQSLKVRVIARDSANNIVLTSGNTFTYESLTPATLTVIPGGTITAIAAGEGKIKATETESGKSATFTLAQPQIIADLYRDFSTTVNPNSAWSYGYFANGSGAFRLFTSTWVDGDLFSWGGLTTNGWHTLGVNRGPNPLDRGDSKTVISPHSVFLHPNTVFGPSVAQWTAPANGTYHVNAIFTGASDTSTGVYLIANGTTLYSGYVGGYLATQTAEKDIVLQAGQAVQFVVTDGGNADQFDTTGLSVTISGL